MPPSQSYKRRCVACQHSSDDQTLQVEEDNFIYLQCGPDRVACEYQEEEEMEDTPRISPPPVSCYTVRGETTLECEVFYSDKMVTRYSWALPTEPAAAAVSSDVRLDLYMAQLLSVEAAVSS